MVKLIVVDRRKRQTYERLLEKFADDPNVRVMIDRRARQRRMREVPHATIDRRSNDRRRLVKDYGGRDYVVIHVVETRR